MSPDARRESEPNVVVAPWDHILLEQCDCFAFRKLARCLVQDIISAAVGTPENHDCMFLISFESLRVSINEAAVLHRVKNLLHGHAVAHRSLDPAVVPIRKTQVRNNQGEDQANSANDRQHRFG